MFGCYNCSVLRSESVREEIRKEIDKKAEELKQKAMEIGLTAQVTITEK